MSTNPAANMPTRIQQNFLARHERRLLNWICPRLPAWTTPDQLTTLGFLGAVMVAAGYVLSWIDDEWLGLALVGYIVNWFGTCSTAASRAGGGSSGRITAISSITASMRSRPF